VAIELKGIEGREKIEKIMQYLRHSMKGNLDNVKIVKKIDYKLGVEKDLIGIKEKTIDLPKSNVLKFILEDKSWFVVRPSGTEPKIKIYISVIGDNLDDSKKRIEILQKKIEKVLNDACNC
jgi:phosphoglucomutase